MRRIVIANEYDLQANVERYARGEYARHLLFGVQNLVPPGWSAEFRGEGLPGPFRGGVLRILTTNLRAMLTGRRADVVYSTFTYGALLSGLLKLVTGRPARIVTVVHGVPAALLRRPRLFAVLYRGHDALAFLSPSDHATLAPHLQPGQRAVWAAWGPSEAWADKLEAAPAPESALAPAPATGRGAESTFALVVGKSKRDWDTLVQAHALRPFPLVVVGGRDCPVPPGAGVTVLVPEAGQREAVTLLRMRQLYRDASVIVLPLVEDRSLNGLTALGEALASGTPTVMTATSAMGGFAAANPGWVTPVPVGDPRALADAIQAGLRAPLPTTPLQPPTAERFEAVLDELLAGDLGQT